MVCESDGGSKSKVLTFFDGNDRVPFTNSSSIRMDDDHDLNQPDSLLGAQRLESLSEQSESLSDGSENPHRKDL